MVTHTVSSAVNLLRRYPLLAFFLLAYGFTWTWILVFLVLLHIHLGTYTNIPVILGPTVAGFIMTYVMQRKAGLGHFLWRFALWDVDLIWYFVALLGPAVILNLGMAVLPGAFATFTIPTDATLRGFPVFFLLVLTIGGPLLEEPGWRGFALPRMQEKWSPWLATLILGLLWAVWHYPLFLIPDWAAQNGGATPLSILIFTVNVILFAVIFTWVFNHTRGSLLLAILLHTGINVTGALILFHADPTLDALISFGIVAVGLVVITRGRLAYDLYLRDEANGMT